jgi:hypothetical protein
MRSRGVVWVVAVMLAVSIGAGSAYAQAPVVPPTTGAEPQGDQSNGGPQGGEDKPKAEAPKAEAPKAEAPKAEAPKAEAPKLEKPGKPKEDKAKAETAKPASPKPQPETPKQAQPKAAKAQPDTPKQVKPKPAKPKATPEPKAAQPKSVQAVAPSAQPAEPGPEPRVAAAKSVSRSPKAASRVAAPRITHAVTKGRAAPKKSPKAASRPAAAAGPARSGTESAGSGRYRTGAPSGNSHAVAATAILAPRVASDGVAAASASLDRQQPRVLMLDVRQSGNATLLLAFALTAGVAFLLGRQARRRPATVSRRSRRVPRSTRLHDEWQSRFWHRRDELAAAVRATSRRVRSR